MIVTMKTQIGGYRNGEAWPAAGGTIDVPDHEAADLIANGYAEEATDAPDPADDNVEPAPVDDEPSDAADDDPGEPAGEDDAAPADSAEVDTDPVKPKRTRKA